MENISEDGRAIYESLTVMAAEERALHKKEVSSLIMRSINTTVDATMTRMVACVAKATTDMHDYSDGVESAVNHNLEALHHQLGLATYVNEPKSSNKAAAGVAKIGPDGHSDPPITQRRDVGPHRPYIPPPESV
jgi:hypothetical protein